MSLAIFGISNSGLNLAVSLLLLVFVVVWLALIVYTYLDARRRLSDPFLVACATIASFFPYVGTAVYAIVRPPEFLEDARERELEIRAAEMRVRQLTEASCPKCEHPIERNFLRCPNCRHRLKDPCPSCSRPVAPSWKVCPYCESTLQARETRPRRGEE
ncbi:MAG TPA: zinc ribbon domain-containing protein, partial [Solirubrobacterales bacterium]|nr:zinc ribbon domain-containing protein [Solirubrobacterales bacterium]